MQDAIVRVILGVGVAGALMGVLVPLMRGNTSAWMAWVIIAACVACALLMGRRIKQSRTSRTRKS